MTKNDILEIKRRYNKESHNFTRIAGCYVDNEKNKVLSFSESPAELPDEELFKYLDIAKKSLSGKLGDNILQLEFPTEEVMNGKTHSLLEQLKATGLKDESVLDEFFDLVIENYLIAGNFLIVLFSDVYDIPMKTTDNLDVGDSEDVLDYILCAICPVNLSKSALGYREDEGRIGALLRNWTVAPVETAFMYPAFSERNADINSVTVYAKNPKAPHKEFWEGALNVTSRLTSSEKNQAFAGMVEKSVGSDSDESKETIFNIADSLSGFIDKRKEDLPDDAVVGINGDDVEDICIAAGVPEQKAERIKERFNDCFDGTPDAPAADELLDKRLLKDQELHHEKAALQREVASLNKQLQETGAIATDGSSSDIYVKVPAERENTVTTAFVDGEKCLIIPLQPSDSATINGENRTL